MSLYHSNNLITRVVDSTKRISGTSSKFVIDLDLPSYAQEFNKICCISASIPKSFYDISSEISGFQLSEGFGIVDINVAAGFYSAISLKSALTTLLNTFSPNGFTYTITYSSVTNKYTFVCSNTTTPIKFDFGLKSLWAQMGFLKNSENDFTSGNLTSTNSISIPKVNRIFIKSDACSSSLDSLLQEVYEVGLYPSLSYIVYTNNNLDLYSKPFSLSTSNTYTFIITDKDGDLIDFQNQEIVFSIALYKKDATSEAVLENMKIDNTEKILNANV